LIVKENLKKNPRYLAVYVLTNVETKKILLDTLINDNENILNQINPKDKALFFNIVYGVLRKRGNLDKIISRNSTKKLSKIDTPVLNTLRTGIYQMVYLEKIPVSAAVNTSVDIVKSIGFKSASGFINGVLRNFSKEFDKDKYLKYEKNAADFPKWIINRWEKRFGKKETEELCTALNQIPPITLRINTIKTTRKDTVELLRSSTENIWQDIIAHESVSLIKPSLPVNKLPGFKKGFFQVQDSGAQFVTKLIKPEPNDKILDACAGLGGKTGHIAQITKGKAKITAVDFNQSKLEALNAEMLRLGFSNCVKTAMVDLSKDTKKINSDFFDKIIVDAPCTGLGVIRRNPDTKWKRIPEDIKQCALIQKNILANSSALLKKGGYLLYSVCSYEPEETTEIINDFLKNHKDFTRAEIEFESKSVAKDDNGDIFILPHKSGTDGFFAALLKKDKKN
jgi:16S rRNA (cytosine967-C5)-methyltransferase